LFVVRVVPAPAAGYERPATNNEQRTNNKHRTTNQIMNPEFAIDLLKTLMLQGLTLAAPFLVVAMVVGLVVSLFQAVTTIHEQTLSFVPKALAVVGALLLLMPWVVRSLTEFATAVISRIPEMVR